MLKEGQKVAYRDAKTKEALVTAVVSGGCCFVCECCNVAHNLSSLEAHTGVGTSGPPRTRGSRTAAPSLTSRTSCSACAWPGGSWSPPPTKRAQKSTGLGSDSLAVDFSALPPGPRGLSSDELCRMCGEGSSCAATPALPRCTCSAWASRYALSGQTGSHPSTLFFGVMVSCPWRGHRGGFSSEALWVSYSPGWSVPSRD